MKGIKYYGRHDLATEGILKEAEEIINKYKSKKHEDINIILELYNCVLYIDNKVYFQHWTEEYKLYLKKQCKKINKDLGCYFSEINELNIEKISKEIEWIYIEDFLALICRYRIYNNIKDEIFSELLNKGIFSIQQVCNYKDIVKRYNVVIKKILMENPLNAELLFDHYALDKEKNLLAKSYIPKSLTGKEIEKLIESYIIKEANLNYLQLIVNNHNTSEFYISDELKLKAQRSIEKQEEIIFKNNNGIEFEYKVVLKKDSPKPVIRKFEGTKISIIIDKNWLEDNLEYETILQNFIYIFNYIDMTGRITFVSNHSEMKTFESIFGVKSKKDYLKGSAFNTKEILSDLMTISYYDFLKKLEVELEKVIEWFFNDYLNKEFGIENYYVTLPSKDTSYKEKCRDILPEIEYVLSQYKSYEEYGYINQELLEISSSGIKYEQLPSLVKNKYVYPNKNLNDIFHYLFSDQSRLNYLYKSEESFESFFELMTKEKTINSDFNRSQQLIIGYLIDMKYLKINEQGCIDFDNKDRIVVLYELYYNDVISYHRVSLESRKEIDLMHKEDLIYFGSTLFSEPEHNYFNYYLNDSKFQNGPKLRNRYLHGTLGSRPNLDESTHKRNYLIIIKLLILMIIKINEEFCLQEMINKTGR